MYQCIKGEDKTVFDLHRGEGNTRTAFTSNHLLVKEIRISGEEVKAKNEKQRTRARNARNSRRTLDEPILVRPMLATVRGFANYLRFIRYLE